MPIDSAAVQDVVAAARGILAAVASEPPHVRPWLRGVVAEAEHVCLDIEAAQRRAHGAFARWLLAEATPEQSGRPDSHGQENSSTTTIEDLCAHAPDR